MRFGTDEVFNYIVEHISDINGFRVYDYIYEIVTRDGMAILSIFKDELNDADKSDILQIVHVKLIHELKDFVEDGRSQTIAKRNAWLKKLIVNKAIDYLRKRNRQPIISWEEIKPLVDIDPYEDTGEDDIIDIITVDQRKAEMRAELDSAIDKLCSIKTSPVNLLSFLYNKALSIIYDNNVNGSPQKVVELLNGRTLFEVFEIVKRTFRDVIGVEISDSAFTKLETKLYEKSTNNNLCGDDLFFTTARTVTDTSSWIKRKFKGMDDKKTEDKEKKEKKNGRKK